MKYTIEIATSDFESTQNAIRGGADRIELCANLSEGGTTQSYGVIRKCRENFITKIYPIIRVRGGDFLYTEEEFECMYFDAINCKHLGCDGVVIGFLNRDGSIDTKRTSKIVEAVYPLGVTFHRAFDRCKNPVEALEQIIQCGCERILTSGQQLTAPDGIELITALHKHANGRIAIMPGSGVRKDNIEHLAQVTGCTEFHTSLREVVGSQMEYIAPSFANDTESYKHTSVNEKAVAELKRIMSR
jgi:copper homeostasis protein